MKRLALMIHAALASMWLAAPMAPPAMAQVSPTTDDAYREVAQWLFDLYLSRSVQLSIAYAARQQTGAEQLLQPRAPAMLLILARHRDDFVFAMQKALRNRVPEASAKALQRRIAQTPVDLDAASRQTLIDVDAEFRRESQSVIRAITSDISVMIADAMTDAGKSE